MSQSQILNALHHGDVNILHKTATNRLAHTRFYKTGNKLEQ